jgi:hypothetical protein
MIIGVLVPVVGGIIARDRAVMKAIAEGDRRVEQRLDEFADQMDRTYAKHSDIQAIQAQIAAVNDNVMRSNTRLDRVLEILASER